MLSPNHTLRGRAQRITALHWDLYNVKEKRSIHRMLDHNATQRTATQPPTTKGSPDFMHKLDTFAMALMLASTMHSQHSIISPPSADAHQAIVNTSGSEHTTRK